MWACCYGERLAVTFPTLLTDFRISQTNAEFPAHAIARCHYLYKLRISLINRTFIPYSPSAISSNLLFINTFTFNNFFPSSFFLHSGNSFISFS